MIKIAICDDDKNVIEQLERYFESISDNDITYEEFFGIEEMERYIQEESMGFDVYILDIEMKNVSGLEFARKLRENNTNVLLIFLTSHPQYVYDVFEVITFDFIMKPVTFEKFEETIQKIKKYLGISKKKFVFSYRKSSCSLPLEKIKYLEKDGRKVWINTVDENKYQCYMKLEEVWKQLDEKMFASLHKSCIVNLEEVLQIIGEWVFLKDGTKLHVGRAYKKELKKKHLDYVKGRL